MNRPLKELLEYLLLICENPNNQKRFISICPIIDEAGNDENRFFNKEEQKILFRFISSLLKINSVNGVLLFMPCDWPPRLELLKQEIKKLSENETN